MLKKVTFGRRTSLGELQIITQYKAFGITLYERAVDHKVLSQFGAAIL